MNTISERTAKLIDLLGTQGFGAKRAAAKVKVNTRYVYEVARRHGLPTNPEIVPGSPTENNICRAIVATNFDLPAVALLFRQAPINIQTVVARIEQEHITKHAGTTHRLHHSRG